MKITRLSFAAVVACMATASFAATDLASAFKEGKLDGRVRAQYFFTDWDQNDQWNQTYNAATGAATQATGTSSKSNLDSKGYAIGGSLIYKTSPLYGVSGGVGFYTTQNIAGLTETGANSNGRRDLVGSYKNTTSSDLFARGPGAATDFSAGYSVLAQSYLQYDISKSSVKVGRFLMTNPFINPNDTKMIPVAIEGASANIQEFGDTAVILDYAQRIKERGMTYFGNMADTGDTPDAIKNYYKTRYTVSSTLNAVGGASGVTAAQLAQYGSGGDAPNVYMIGVKNKSVKDLELQGWVMNWPDIVRQYMLEANYNLKIGSIGLGLGARYMHQSDQGAGDLITPASGRSIYSYSGVTNGSPIGSRANDVNLKGDSDDKVDTNLYAVRAIVSYEKAKFLLAYAFTDKGGDLIAPWRGFPTEGYTRSMTQTDWVANTKSYKAQLDYDFSGFIKGVSALLGYSYYDRDPSRIPYQSCTDRYYGNGDTKQWNFDVKYVVPYVKGLEWKVRTMIQKNDIVPTSKTYGTNNSYATASEGFGNDTSNKELRIEMNYFF